MYVVAHFAHQLLFYSTLFSNLVVARPTLTIWTIGCLMRERNTIYQTTDRSARTHIMSGTELKEIDNGKLHGAGRGIGATRYYSCDEGFILIGKAHLFCTDKFEWSPSLPACVCKLRVDFVWPLPREYNF